MLAIQVFGFSITISMEKRKQSPQEIEGMLQVSQIMEEIVDNRLNIFRKF
ncbi:hypothetical protein DNHGIG_09660 [Collibacillus ludicampi]|uniref:YrzI family small protein n=1 Tax=Collibacillus ludicampi TaxID=2771369 RepID=A0AAV4LDB9_9BACL|nr:YrzI family small protein [Collibacillus ludicampi]GIM45417.1 hypothetical protein DNHGIG_09660 [Collibacillus ludicampi]